MTAPPEGYDPARYEVVGRYLQGLTDLGIGSTPRINVPRHFLLLGILPGASGKFDANARGPVSTDCFGENWDYPDAGFRQTGQINYGLREAIWKLHERHIRGWMWFFQGSGDPRVWEGLREDFRQYWLAADEFLTPYPGDAPNWPTQLYVREARCLVSDYVLTETDTSRQDWEEIPYASSVIGFASYTADSHHVRRYAMVAPDSPFGYRVFNEGDFFKEAGGANGMTPLPYEILRPKKAECTNLLTPWSVSASHVAMGVTRMITTNAAGYLSATRVNDLEAATSVSPTDTLPVVQRVGTGLRTRSMTVATIIARVDTAAADAVSARDDAVSARDDAVSARDAAQSSAMQAAQHASGAGNAAAAAASARDDAQASADLAGQAAAAAATSQADINNRIDYFDDRTVVANRVIPAEVNAFYLRGYGARGDGGDSGPWLRVGTEPSHPAKISDFAGQWFELRATTLTPRMFGARGDGATNDTSAFQAVAAALRPGNRVDMQGLDYALDGWIVINTPETYWDFSGCNVQQISDVRGLFVFDYAAHRTTVEGGRFFYTGTRSNPRQYWIDTNNTNWFGTTAYSRATTILVTTPAEFHAFGQIFENLFEPFYLAGHVASGGIARNGRIEAQVFDGVDFGILFTCQNGLRINDVKARNITLTTNSGSSPAGLPPHAIYASSNADVDQMNVRISNVYCEDTPHDSVVKIKRCPGAYLENIRGKSTGIVVNVEKSPKITLSSIVGEDIYRSLSSVGSAIVIFGCDDAEIVNASISLRDGEDQPNAIQVRPLIEDGVTTPSRRARIINPRIFSKRQSSVGARPIAIRDGSHFASVESPVWVDTSDTLTAREMVEVISSDDVTITEPTMIGANRLCIFSGTTERTRALVDSRRLYSGWDIWGFRNTGVGTGFELKWLNGSLNNRTYTNDFTLTGENAWSPLRVNRSIAVSVTIPAGLPVGSSGRLLQIGAGGINVVAGPGVTLRGPTSTTVQFSGLQWDLIATDEVWLSRIGAS